MLSVVVPFYGVEAYLEDCLRSLAEQSLRDIEVVLVDDGSLDGSRAVADAWCARDPRFRVVAQPNAGLGPARNTGAGGATGRYIAFADSDDVLPVHAYERLVGSLERSGSDIAAGGVGRFVAGGDARPSWLHAPLFGQAVEGTTLAEVPRLGRDRMVWNKVYRRSFWTGHGLRFPAIRYEDWPVTLRAYQEARSVDLVRGTVYYWRDRESLDSITQQSRDLANFTDRVASAAQVTALVREAEPDVRREVHDLLARVDVVVGLRLFATVPRRCRPELRRLLDELTGMLDPSALAGIGIVPRAQLRLLQRGRPGAVGLSVRAQDAGLGAAAKGVARRVPGLLLPVRTHLRSLGGVPGGLEMTGAVRPATGSAWPRDRLDISLRDATHRALPCRARVDRQRGPAGGWELGFRVRVDDADLDAPSDATDREVVWPITVWISLRHGVRTIAKAPALDTVTEAEQWHRLPSGDAVHVAASPGSPLTLHRWVRPVLADAWIEDAQVVVRRRHPAGERPDGSWSVVLCDPTGGVVVRAAAEAATGVARLDLAGVLGLGPDDPVAGTSTYDLLWSLPADGDAVAGKPIPMPVLGRVLDRAKGGGAHGPAPVRLEGGTAGLRVVADRRGD